MEKAIPFLVDWAKKEEKKGNIVLVAEAALEDVAVKILIGVVGSVVKEEVARVVVVVTEEMLRATIASKQGI